MTTGESLGGSGGDERVVVERRRVGIEGVVIRLEVDDGLVVTDERAMHEAARGKVERELVHTLLDVERLRGRVRRRERQAAVRRRKDNRPELVLEL